MIWSPIYTYTYSYSITIYLYTYIYRYLLIFNNPCSSVNWSAIKSPDFNLRNICYFTVIVNNNSKIRWPYQQVKVSLRTNYVNVSSYHSISKTSSVCMHAPQKKNIYSKSGKIKRYLFSVRSYSNHQFIGGSIKISDGSNARKQNNINKLS